MSGIEHPLDYDLLPAVVGPFDPELADLVRVARDALDVPKTPIANLHWRLERVVVELQAIERITAEKGASLTAVLAAIARVRQAAENLPAMPVMAAPALVAYPLGLCWRDRLRLLWRGQLTVQGRGLDRGGLELWLPGRRPRRLFLVRGAREQPLSGQGAS